MNSKYSSLKNSELSKQFSTSTKALVLPVGSFLLNRYQILKQINGERVYLVADVEESDRLFALKVSDRNLIFTEEYNLRREFIVHSSFESDNIVKLNEPLESEDIFGFLMEFIGGGDVSDRFNREGKFSIERALKIFKGITNALVEVHKKGFIHGDIKPENILLSSTGVIKLTDFGIARDLKYCKTHDQETKGTLRYLCPVYLTTGALNPSSDIFSLALVIYEILTGHVPFDSLDVMQILQRRVYEESPKLSSLIENCPKELDYIISKCLSLDPAQRYADVSELNADLERVVVKEVRRQRKNSTRIKLFKDIPNTRRSATTRVELDDEKVA